MKQKDIRSLTLAVIVLVVVVGAYMLSSGHGSLGVNQPAAVAVPFEPLTHGVQSAVTSRTNYLVTNADDLKLLWNILDQKGAPPVVDFSHKIVVVVFAGAGAYKDITVNKIEDAGTRTVSVTLTKFDHVCSSLRGAQGTPYEMVAVSPTELPFTHKDVITIASCTD